MFIYKFRLLLKEKIITDLDAEFHIWVYTILDWTMTSLVISLCLTASDMHKLKWNTGWCLLLLLLWVYLVYEVLPPRRKCV